jgi:hypothetical protein
MEDAGVVFVEGLSWLRRCGEKRFHGSEMCHIEQQRRTADFFFLINIY